MVYAIAFSFSGASSLVSSLMVRFLLDDWGYEVFYYIGAAFSAISLVILVLLFPDKKVM